MTIPEDQLETWSYQGSITQSKNTYATIKLALEDDDTKYAEKQYSIFLQGSYGNDTNIYAESDVDIVMKLNSTFYTDINGLTDDDKARYNNNRTPASYSYETFKGHVIEALEERFGEKCVKPGNKAIKIKAAGGRRSADVLVCANFRKYRSYSASRTDDYKEGICFWTDAGERIVNYPRQHSQNCTTKHQATSSRFKPMVRILKNMRSKLVDDGVLAAGIAPSYYIEGLMYNVPTDKFGSSYGDTFVEAINWMREADRAKFVCPHERYYLLWDNSETSWPSANCDAFRNAVTTLWNDW